MPFVDFVLTTSSIQAEAPTLPITAYQANMIDIETSALVRLPFLQHSLTFLTTISPGPGTNSYT